MNKKNSREMRMTVIKKMAKENEQENWAFRNMLKTSGLQHEYIDNCAHEIYETLKQEINCVDCGCCCKRMTPTLSQADIKRLAKHFKMSVDDVQKKWLTHHDQIGTVFSSRPCPFWEKKICTIYPARPHDCRAYPHLHNKNILNYFTSIILHVDLCPYMFHFIEGMKKKFARKIDKR